MTSERECYVYIQLPGTHEVVTCGLFVRAVRRDGTAVGRFVYGRSYRARPDAVPVDPYNLPVRAGEFETAALKGVFGALRDAAPDSWGRMVIDRFAGRDDLDEVDYLLLSPEDRAGALSFGHGKLPPPPVHRFNKVLQLAALRETARILEEERGDRADALLREQLRNLNEPASAMGGARPKNVVEDESGLWLAKFAMRSDRWENAAVEAGMTTLAGLCGIRVPDLRVERMPGGSPILLLRRFDREKDPTGYLRHRMVSALTVLNADDGGTDRRAWSYVLLADELRRWSSRPAEDREELFRRMAFIALISNTDDHPRNHALVAAGADWRLAPAYDLTPSPSISLEARDLAMACGSEGRRATRSNLVSQAPRFGLAPEAAGGIIDQMRRVVETQWRSQVRRHGGGEADCDAIASAIVPAGFSHGDTEARR
ncbi:MAG TPA: type II toxin-antitoxin system HipA family toxin [Longimicrobium sp.]|jgi:serine/threonine-protein kinase HipA